MDKASFLEANLVPYKPNHIIYEQKKNFSFFKTCTIYNIYFSSMSQYRLLSTLEEGEETIFSVHWGSGSCSGELGRNYQLEERETWVSCIYRRCIILKCCPVTFPISRLIFFWQVASSYFIISFNYGAHRMKVTSIVLP